MSSRFPSAARLGLVLAAASMLAAGCQRETREVRGAPLPETAPVVSVSQLYPGAPTPPSADPRAKSYEENAFHVAQGSRLFRWYNCNGCHANGGGGMGPPLMDDQWRYGGSMEQIYATIAQGRPNGMPMFGSKVPPEQIWQLAAYVRSLSGNTPAGARSTRRDAATSLSPRSQTTPETPVLADAGAGQVPQP